MLIMMTLALTIGVQDVPRAPMHWSGGLSLRVVPRAEYPERERGVVQARVTCTVAEAGRVRDCRIDRLLPERTRFGVSVLRGMRGARVADPRAVPGDTFSIDIWACSVDGDVRDARCNKSAWPVDAQAQAD